MSEFGIQVRACVVNCTLAWPYMPDSHDQEAGGGKGCVCVCARNLLCPDLRFSNLHWESGYCMSVLPSVRKTMCHKFMAE